MIGFTYIYQDRSSPDCDYDAERITTRAPEPPPIPDEQDFVDPLILEIEPKRFKADCPPPQRIPIATLAGIRLCTAGNLSLITGQEGVAKSRFAAALLASTMTHEDGDFLGWDAPNPLGKSVLYLDNEMAPQDFHGLLAGSLRRARLKEPPPWFQAWNLTGTEPGKLLAILKATMKRAAKKCGGVHLVFLDGFADFLKGVNDELEANELVRVFMELAQEFDCAILGVIHCNSGAESTKPRGHLGSQLQRKGEATLLLKRNSEGVICAYAPNKTRGGPLPESKGPRFQWCNDFGDFVSISTKAEAQMEAKTAEKLQDARDIFGPDASLKYQETVDRVMRIFACAEKAAQMRVSRMRKAGILAICGVTHNWHIPAKWNNQ